MEKKLYVDVNEVIADWGVSRAKAYEMIKDLNKRFRKINPNFIVINGKSNMSLKP